MIRWGYYIRRGLPLFVTIRIQRVRCKNCGRTTNVLPSFLLAYKSYVTDALKNIVQSYVTSPDDWKKSLDISIDVTTAYRWLRKLKQQANHSLPLIRKTLLELNPEHRVDDEIMVEPPQLTSKRQILKRFLFLSERLLKVAVRLVDDKTASFKDCFCFINYFLAQKTQKALIQP